MKGLLLFFLFATSFITCGLPLQAQTGPSIQWDKTFGGNNWDNLQVVKRTSNGGYILGGSSESGSGGDKSHLSQGDYDYWLIKIDSSGNKEWDKAFGGSGQDLFNSLEQTLDGGYILSGHSDSPISGDKTHASKGGIDYWIIKLDANGNKVWDKTFGGDGFDEFPLIRQTPDGSFVLGGTSSSNISGDKTQSMKGNVDYWIIKIDIAGNKLWDKTIGGDWSEYLRSLELTSDGGIILGGYSNSPIGFDKSQPARGYHDYWVVKLDGNGNRIWDKTLGGNNQDHLVSLKQAIDGGYILGGWSRSPSSGDKSQNSQGYNDYWIIKIDANGNKLWDKTLGGTSSDDLWSLQQTSEGGFILGGTSSSNVSGDKTDPSKGREDFWIVKIDSNGNKLWDKTVGGSSADYLYSLDQTADGGFILGGISESGISGDKSQASKGNVDYWVVKLASPCLETNPALTSSCNSDSTLSGSIIGLSNLPNKQWTLKYAVNGSNQIATGTTSSFQLASNALPGTIFSLVSIEVNSCIISLNSTLIVKSVPKGPKVVSKVNCQTGVITLSVTERPASVNYVLYDSEKGESVIQSSTSGLFIIPSSMVGATVYIAGVNDSGCEGPRVPFKITPITCPSPTIPNIITPNGDKFNDTFKPQNLPAGFWQLKIFNRWGTTIYETEDYQNNWPEKKITDGVYYFTLKNIETGQLIKGWIEVIH